MVTVAAVIYIKYPIFYSTISSLLLFSFFISFPYRSNFLINNYKFFFFFSLFFYFSFPSSIFPSLFFLNLSTSPLSSYATPLEPPPPRASPPLPVRGAAWPSSSARHRRRVSPSPPYVPPFDHPTHAAVAPLVLIPPRVATAMLRDLPYPSLARSDEGLPPPFGGIRPSVRAGSRRRRRSRWDSGSLVVGPDCLAARSLAPPVGEGSDPPPRASSRCLPATAGLAPPPWAPRRLLLPILLRATSPLFLPAR